MPKITHHKLHEMKNNNELITMVTAYDYPSGLLADASGAEMILVGDSVGMVVHGFENTLSVTMDMMVMHCQAVTRAVKRAFVVGDMPFGSYQTDLATAKRNAVRLLAEANVDAVKLEGGQPMAATVRALVDMGIAVHGHIGLTPQSVSAFGGFKVQGRSLDDARRLLDDALAIQDAGAFAIVLEGVPLRLAEIITNKLDIPTIGIGAGPRCDGQVLVWHDLLGLYNQKAMKFVKQYAQLDQPILSALEAYRDDVRAGNFPTDAHSFHLNDDVWQAISAEFGEK